MALYRCVGVDNPGPQRTNKYVRAVTSSTGGSDGSIRLQYYDNGAMLQEVNISYANVLGRENGYNFRDMVKLWYNSGATSWVLDAIEDCVYSNSLLVAGDIIYTWGYGNRIDFNVYEIVLEPTKTPILVSTGQQYITLPIYKDENDVLKIRFRVKTFESEKCIIGSGWEVTEYLFHPYLLHGNGDPIYRYFTGQQISVDGPRNTRLGGLDTYDEIELGYGYIIVNGERYENTPSQNTGHIPIYMFGVASSGTGQHLINMAVTEVKIYKNDILTYDLVPHKKDNGDGCFIDVLNNNTEYASETQTPLVYDEIGGTCESFLVPNKYWFGTLADYDALTTYDEQTVYNIQPSFEQRQSIDVNFTQKIYIGENQVFPQVKEGWDYYIENLTFPDTLPSGKRAADLGILTDIDLESTANYQRNWQLEFNCEYSQTATINGDQVIFGCQSTNYSMEEIYFNPSGQLCLYANGVSDDDYLNDAIGHDIKLIFRGDGTGLEIYKDNIYQSTLSSYRQSEYTSTARHYMSIGQWGTNKSYYFHGTIHYLKFKWLD